MCIHELTYNCFNYLGVDDPLTRYPQCFVNQTCDDEWSNVAASPMKYLQENNIPMTEWNKMIQECLDFIEQCGCIEPYSVNQYDNMCFTRPDECTPPCQCEGPGSDFMEVSSLHHAMC